MNRLINAHEYYFCEFKNQRDKPDFLEKCWAQSNKKERNAYLYYLVDDWSKSKENKIKQLEYLPMIDWHTSLDKDKFWIKLFLNKYSRLHLLSIGGLKAFNIWCQYKLSSFKKEMYDEYKDINFIHFDYSLHKTELTNKQKDLIELSDLLNDNLSEMFKYYYENANSFNEELTLNLLKSNANHLIGFNKTLASINDLNNKKEEKGVVNKNPILFNLLKTMSLAIMLKNKNNSSYIINEDNFKWYKNQGEVIGLSSFLTSSKVKKFLVGRVELLFLKSIEYLLYDPYSVVGTMNNVFRNTTLTAKEIEKINKKLDCLFDFEDLLKSSCKKRKEIFNKDNVNNTDQFYLTQSLKKIKQEIDKKLNNTIDICKSRLDKKTIFYKDYLLKIQAWSNKSYLSMLSNIWQDDKEKPYDNSETKAYSHRRKM